MDEKEIISRCLMGDGNAFEMVVNRYQSQLLHFTWNILGDKDEANDVTQDSFVRSYLHLQSYDTNRSFKTWLYTIAYNRCMDKIREKQSRTRFIKKTGNEQRLNRRRDNPEKIMCEFIRFLYMMIPIHGFRAYLIQRHLGACSQCQGEWVIDKNTEESFTKSEWAENKQNLWPQIQKKIKATEFEEINAEKRKKTFHFPHWQWTLAGLTFLIFIVINLVLNKGLIHSLSKKEVSLAIKIPQVKIIHAEIRGKKARPFIYQTPENFFIWFDKTRQEGD